jgi:hypothetical protein
MKNISNGTPDGGWLNQQPQWWLVTLRDSIGFELVTYGLPIGNILRVDGSTNCAKLFCYISPTSFGLMVQPIVLNLWAIYPLAQWVSSIGSNELFQADFAMM